MFDSPKMTAKNQIHKMMPKIADSYITYCVEVQTETIQIHSTQANKYMDILSNTD